MDKEQLLFEIEKNIKDFKNTENTKSMIMLAIYEKKIAELKEAKIKQVKEYFLNQISFFEQNASLYEYEINEIVKEYTFQIDKLVEAYNYLYLNTYKNMQKAINNQIISMGNIVTLWNKREQPGTDVDKINCQIIAILQKKVNYSVIVEECKARLNWCIENSQNDINNIFENKFYQIQLYQEGFFQKIKRKILNLIGGKNQLRISLNKYENESLNKILENNGSKIVEIFAITSGILKQISNVEKQINIKYEEQMQSA